jgi:hypothetical protein
MDKAKQIGIFLLLAGLVFLLVYFGSDIWHWILTVTGDQTAGSRWNLAWSGFLSAGVISGSIFTHAYHSAKAKNCHNKGCWRIAQKTTADGHRLCHVCAAKPISALRLPDIHPDHAIGEQNDHTMDRRDWMDDPVGARRRSPNNGGNPSTD